MKFLEFMGGCILVLAFIIGLFEYGFIILFAPVGLIIVLILLMCGCKLK